MKNKLFYFILFTKRFDSFYSELAKDQKYRFDDNRFKKQSTVSISNIEHSKYVKANSKILQRRSPGSSRTKEQQPMQELPLEHKPWKQPPREQQSMEK
jgi:hypothetical protein